MLRTLNIYILTIALAAATRTLASDWPTHMRDNARSGATTNTLSLPLSPLWTYRAPAAPKPAWPDPQKGYTELPQLKFDDALHVAAADGRIFFGSSVDNQAHALDATTGQSLWTFFTDGPVRLAPAVAGNRVYAASDDGFVYCLQAADGRLLWKFSGAPKPEFMLGGGRVTSLWPIRTGVLVEDGNTYFASGIFSWSGHGIRLYALTADEGKTLWSQDGITGYNSKTPPGPLYDWAPQGYLLAADQSFVVPGAPGNVLGEVEYLCATNKLLIIPGGRGMPTFWNRSDGRRILPAKAPAWTKNDAAGVYGVVALNHVYVGSQGALYGFGLTPDAGTDKFGSAKQLVAHNDIDYVLYAGGLDPKSHATHSIRALSRSNGDQSKPLWTYRRPGLDSMIVAGAHVIAGGTNEVIALDADTGKEVWTGAVTGRAAGLAVADGHLFVSTDQGTIHCFGKNSGRQIHDQGGTGVPPVVSEDPIRHGRDARATLTVWPAIPGLSDASKAARDILAALDERRGFAIVAGAGSDALACALARQSEMNVYVYEPDEARGDAARKRVDAEGLYGRRVTVNIGVTNALPYPDYMANLIVHAGGAEAVSAAEWLRVLRPCGGVLLAGGWGTSPPTHPTEADCATYTYAGALSRNVSLAGGSWTKLTRGELDGSGWWTHAYADAGNTGSSGDRLVAGRMQILWCGEPGAEKFPDRSVRRNAPLVLNGRVFCPGFDFPSQKYLLLSFDAYNGTPYWEREAPGALPRLLPRAAGNLACATNGLFVAVESACHRLDIKTGKTISVYETPKMPDGKLPLWGYLSTADGRLFGSATLDTNLYSSSSVFACDISTGRRLWVYSGRDILDGTLVYGEGRLFFLDQGRTGGVSMATAPPAPIKPVKNGETLDTPGDKAVDRLGQEAPSEFTTPMIRTLTALDADTGRELFTKSLDVKGMGSALQMLFADGKLIVCGAFGPYGRPNPDEPFRRAMALSARDGAQLWNEAVGNVARPIVMGDWLFAPPTAYDLKTGAPAMRYNPRKKSDEPVAMPRHAGCGQVSASASEVFFRHWYTTCVDLATGATGYFYSIKPGCYINIIPAGGVVAQVEASSGCVCDYALQGTFVFKPAR